MESLNTHFPRITISDLTRRFAAHGWIETGDSGPDGDGKWGTPEDAPVPLSVQIRSDGVVTWTRETPVDGVEIGYGRLLDCEDEPYIRSEWFSWTTTWAEALVHLAAFYPVARTGPVLVA